VDQITLGKEFGISMYEKRYENSRCPKKKKRGDNEIFTKEENVNEHIYRLYNKLQLEW
jgi:hypothetical protein